MLDAPAATDRPQALALLPDTHVAVTEALAAARTAQQVMAVAVMRRVRLLLRASLPDGGTVKISQDIDSDGTLVVHIDQVTNPSGAPYRTGAVQPLTAEQIGTEFDLGAPDADLDSVHAYDVLGVGRYELLCADLSEVIVAGHALEVEYGSAQFTF